MTNPAEADGERAPEDRMPAREGAVVGVDYGTVRIGLALGELRSGLVLPLPVLEHPGTLAAVGERLEDICRGRNAAVVLIGNPVHMSGEGSNMSVTVTTLRDDLRRRLGVPVLLRDERLTSVNAEEQLAAQGLRWWQYSKGRIDTLSAMTIVREYLAEVNPELGKVEEAPPPEPDGDAPRGGRRGGRRGKRRRGVDDGAWE